MPLYEYQCKRCGKVVEVLQFSGEAAPRECPSCGSTVLVKLLTAPRVIRSGEYRRKGTTCCGLTERCDAPPCEDDGTCRTDRR